MQKIVLLLFVCFLANDPHGPVPLKEVTSDSYRQDSSVSGWNGQRAPDPLSEVVLQHSRKGDNQLG